MTAAKKPAVVSVKEYLAAERDIWNQEYYASISDVVPLSEIEAELPLRDIYAGLDFPAT